MLFNSFAFAIFLPVVFILYWALPKKCQWAVILVSSYYFYMSWNVKYVFLILLTTVVSYITAILLEKEQNGKRRKFYLSVAFAFCLGVLFFFKYFNFISVSIAGIVQRFTISYSPFMINVLLPVGISFYTFQTLAYVIDVYRGDVNAEYHFGKYAAFISFFPQLVAGPIERTSNLLPQIKRENSFAYGQASYGLKLMVWGFFKKIVIADTLAVYVDMVYNNLHDYTGMILGIATIFFTIQIYCDFSGYSDMAIGLALMLGFRFKDNFNAPFKSQSPTEFWRRWHISLSSWLRDYIYIPLGGNRRGKARQYVNLTVTMLAGGLWHGASWMYLLWGGYNGALLAAHKAVRKHWPAPRRLKGTRLLAAANITLTMALIMAGMMIFRAHTPADIAVMSRQILTDFRPQVIPSFIEAYMLITCIIAGAWMMHWLPRRHTIGLMRRFSALPTAAQAAILAIAIFFIIQTRQADLVPFVYLKY